MKQIIKIIVIDEDHDAVIGAKSCENIEIAEQTLGTINKWVDKYKKENYDTCCQCGEDIHFTDLTSPEDNEDLTICHKCLELVLSGQEKLK